MTNVVKGQPEATRHYPVRLRWVWGGTALCIVGLGFTAAELMLESRTWAIVGAVLVVLGLLLAWAGGVLYDVTTGQEPHAEFRDALHGEIHEGRSVHQLRHEPHAALVTQQTAQRMRSVTGPRTHAPAAPAAVAALLVAGVWMMAAELALAYPLTSAAGDARLREDAVAVVVLLAGLRLRVAGRSRIASLLCLVAGVLLVLAGALITDVAGQVHVNELITGVVIVAAAITTMMGGWGTELAERRASSRP